MSKRILVVESLFAYFVPGGQCPTPPLPFNGYTVLSSWQHGSNTSTTTSTTAIGSTATFYCNYHGYVAVPYTSVTCTTDGSGMQWNYTGNITCIGK